MKDLTKGKPILVILSFMLPILLSGVFQQLYSIADTMIVGKVLGEASLAAIGATSAVSTLIIGFLRGASNGFGLIVSRYFGAGKQDDMRRSIAGTILLTLGLTALLTILGFLFLSPILSALRTPEDIFPQSRTYLGILFCGMLFTGFYNMCSSILMALGDSKTPMNFLILSVCVNILLDLLFVAVFHFGVAGAAFATVLSQFLSALLCGIHIWKHIPEILPEKTDFFRKKLPIRDLTASGFSMGLMFCIVDVGTVIMQSSINGFGTIIIAAHTASRKIIELVCMFLDSVGAAMATFTSQNHGAGQKTRIRKGVRQALILNFAGATVIVAVSLLFERQIISGLTGSSEQKLLDAASLCLRVNAPFYYVLSIFFVLRSTLQGVGGKLIPILSSLIELAGKIAAVWILAPKLGYLGICITEPITWTLCTLLLLGQVLLKRDRYF